MTINLILKGQPRTTSQIYKYHCKFGTPSGYMSKEGKDLKIDYQWQVKQQYRGSPFVGPLKMTFIIFFGTKRKCDWDNFNKLACDAMSGLVYEDDSQIIDARVIKNYDKINPRIEVEIIELP